MPARKFTVKVQPDFLERQTKAKPLQAIAELIWNGLDADATAVDVAIDSNKFGMQKITVRDNGDGIPYDEAPKLFERLGGSWKKQGTTTKNKGRRLHGYEGRGRFKAFALGRVVDWHVVYRADNDSLRSYSMTMFGDHIREIQITEEQEAETDTTGVEVTVSELHHEFRTLESENASQELCEMFALYLKDYRDALISYEGLLISPESVIASTGTFALPDINDNGKKYSVGLEIIEWRAVTKRALYLCSEKGFPLAQSQTRFHIGKFQFSAYLKSPFIRKLHEEAQLDLAEMNSTLTGAVEEALEKIKTYFGDRSAEQARTVVEEWKAEKIYPYEGEAASPIEEVERKVFDIVALSVNDYMPEFAEATVKTKSFQLKMLRQAIERSPEELQVILNEVLDLPKRKQEELANLLREASLSAIINAAKTVADRLKFLSGLEMILFNGDLKKHLKERSQLHRLLAENTWIFGEEFNLSVDDQSLTEVLRKHREFLGDEIVIDQPVKHVSKTRGIVDLMLSRTLRSHRVNGIEHLVVELKAPKVKIGKEEVSQIEGYAFSVMDDERFKRNGVQWTFWVISDDILPFAEKKILENEQENGTIYRRGNSVIAIKTWSQVIEDNKARLQFFQEKLEHKADQGATLKYLQEQYPDFVKGVVTEEVIEQYSAPEDFADAQT